MTDEEMAEKYAKGNTHYEIAKRENGADYAKEVSSVTISQAFLAGLEYKNKENAELKEKISILLSCKNCPENKGGWICAKEYENKCLAQKIEFIKELEKENAKLQEKLNIRSCQNCKHNNKSCPNDGSCVHYNKWEEYKDPQLTKAKELIKEMLSILPKENIEGVYEITEEAEEFLKEVEE